MPINSAIYLKSIVPGVTLPEDNFPIYGIIGRSNVGKSSLINSITNQKGLARSGSTPGVTKKINLFLLNKNIFFADLPGYGYAKMSRQDRNTIQQLIYWFITDFTPKPNHILLLIEAKIGPTKDDLEIINLLNNHNIDYSIILSKTDKIKASERHQQIIKLQKAIPNKLLIPFSIKTLEGKKDILNIMGV